tara:strand:+ start:161 stop:352 length:192 start_codon:yes stop_codon:yes gene_type:complete
MRKKKSTMNIWILFIIFFLLWQLFKFGVLRDGFKNEKKEMTPEETIEMIERLKKYKEKNKNEK